MGIKAAVRVLFAKQSGARMSSLAGRYINIQGANLALLTVTEREQMAAELRSLAASVLSQDETPLAG